MFVYSILINTDISQILNTKILEIWSVRVCVYVCFIIIKLLLVILWLQYSCILVIFILYVDLLNKTCWKVLGLIKWPNIWIYYGIPCSFFNISHKWYIIVKFLKNSLSHMVFAMPALCKFITSCRNEFQLPMGVIANTSTNINYKINFICSK